MNVQYFLSIYDQFRQTEITHRRFKHADLLRWLAPYFEPFDAQNIGKSEENRNIFRFKFGNGKTKIMLWSQMHGNEATATMAMLDIFAYLLNAKDCEFRNLIQENLTLYFIPMVNPDGAERFQRRSASGIDINRDFLQLATAEAQILKQQAEEISPEYGFNLHDQNKTYGVGDTVFNSKMTFLAPAAEETRSITPARRAAMHVCNALSKSALQIFPNCIAKYSDEYEKRAFGDNFQRLGISTILVESGYNHGDFEKQALRKAHFALLLEALSLIAADKVAQNLEVYDSLLNNENNRFADILLKNIKFGKSAVDVALAYEEVSHQEKGFEKKAFLFELGDLRAINAFDEFDMSNFSIQFLKEPSLNACPNFQIFQHEALKYHFEGNFDELLQFLLASAK